MEKRLTIGRTDLWSVEDGGTYYLLKPGYDPEYARFGPGHLLVEQVDKLEPDAVISDFESWTYWFAKGQAIPIISVDNMQIISRCSHEGDVIGEVMARLLSLKDRQAEFGIALDPHHRGRAFGVEALAALFQYCFETLHLHRLIGYTDVICERIRDDEPALGHFREYTMGELKGYAAATGFAVVHARFYSYFDCRYEDSTGDGRRWAGTLRNVLNRVLPGALQPGITMLLRKTDGG